jgi:hypothetical protein
VPVLRTNHQKEQRNSKLSSQPGAGPSNKQSLLATRCRSFEQRIKRGRVVWPARHDRTKSIDIQAFLATRCRSFEQTIAPRNPVPVLRTNNQKGQSSAACSTRVVWPARHGRTKSIKLQAFLATRCRSFEQTIKKGPSSVALSRSHQVNQAPSLPRNPVPVFRTNNQRSRVVWRRRNEQVP